MGWGNGNLGVGGAAGLNFEVFGGTSKPTNPKENTIWVDTDSIHSWAFSATAPENPEDDMVWFSVGSSSSAAFNALKKNSVMVYPLYAKQYVSGAWVDRTAKSYQNGGWVEWLTDFILVDTNGVRDGYTKRGATNTTCTVNSNNIVVKYSGGSGSTAQFSWADIDVTEYKVLEFTLTGVSFIGSSKSIEFYVRDAASVTATGAGTYELDISKVSGFQQVGFNSQGASFTVTDWRLKH